MKGRRAFTLLEVLVAVAVTALAGVAAAAALQAASGAGDRVARLRRASEGEARVRTLLTDALRHLPPASAVDGPLLAVVPDSTGPTLLFPSRGIVPPFGTGAPWRVAVRRRGDSLVVDAAPPASSQVPVRHAAVGQVRELAIQVLDGDGGWRPDWPIAGRAPQAVEVAWRSTGAVAPAVRVRLAPLGWGGVQ